MKSLLCVFSIFLICSCSREKSLHTLFPKLKWNATLQKAGIVVDKEFQEKTFAGVKLKFTGNLSKHLLIVDETLNVDPDQATKIFKSKTFMIKGLYTITKEANCMSDIQIDPLPVDNKFQTSLLFNLKATERLVLGVCLEEQNIYRNQTLILYCKNKNAFYDIRYYYPKTDSPILVPIALCAN